MTASFGRTNAFNQSAKQRASRSDGVEFQVFLIRVQISPHGTQTIQNGDSERGEVISVGAPASWVPCINSTPASSAISAAMETSLFRSMR